MITDTDYGPIGITTVHTFGMLFVVPFLRGVSSEAGPHLPV